MDDNRFDARISVLEETTSHLALRIDTLERTLERHMATEEVLLAEIRDAIRHSTDPLKESMSAQDARLDEIYEKLQFARGFIKAITFIFAVVMSIWGVMKARTLH